MKISKKNAEIMERGKRSSRSILWAWTASYIVILLIPLITVFVNYNINMATIRQDVRNANKLTLDNMKDNIDGLIESAKGFQNYVISEGAYKTIQYYEKPEGGFFYDVIDLFDAVKSYASSSPVGASCMISMNDLDYVVSNSTTGKSHIFYRALYTVNPSLVSFEEWQAIIQKEYRNEFFIEKDILIGSKAPNLYFANTLKSGYNGNVNILVGISLDRIAELTEYLSEDTCLILQIDNNSVAAFSAGEMVEVPANFANDSEIAENGWVQLSADSEQNKISYSLLYSKDSYSDALAYTWKMFIITVILTVLFGIAGMVILLKCNYRPIRNLMEEMDIDVRGGNELQEISKLLKGLKLENASSRRIVDNQKQQIISSWLLSMMKGRSTSLQIKERESSFSLDISGNIALVGFMIPLTENVEVKHDELHFFIVDNIFSELMDGFRFYRVEDGRFLLYLFDLQDMDEEQWNRLAIEKTEYLYNFLEDKWNVPLVGVVSDVEYDFTNLRFLYKKIMEAFEYKSVMGDAGIMHIGNLENRETDMEFLECMRNELQDAIKEGNKEKALTSARRFFGRQEKLPFILAKMHVFDAVNIIIDIFKEYEPDSVRRVEMFQYAEFLLQAQSIEEQKRGFRELLEFVCDQVTMQMRLEIGDVVDNVKEYVRQYYQDSNLNISMIAEKMQRNPKYISRVFKEKTGEGILDYLNRVRIEKAKHLIASPRYTAEEVAEMVGYANVRTFRRAFVKIVGEIPSKFMKK